MLGHASISEISLSSTLGVIQSGVADIIGTSTKTSVGVGVLTGTADISSNFTQDTLGSFISSAAADISSNFSQTTENIKRIREESLTLDASFTKPKEAGAIQPNF